MDDLKCIFEVHTAKKCFAAGQVLKTIENRDYLPFFYYTYIVYFCEGTGSDRESVSRLIKLGHISEFFYETKSHI